MKFIGIDLAWTSGATGLCCLVWQDHKLQILDCQRCQQLSEIWAWLDYWVKQEETALIAVDAPTLIPNATGMRVPDRLTHKYFGRYHAGCYPANLSRPFAKRTTEFGVMLEKRGFIHAPTMTPQKLGRFQIEVFPHPAMVNLFNLDRILKYKKGRLAARKVELAKMRQYIQSVLPQREPALNWNHTSFPTLQSDFLNLKGTELKVIEDQLDSLICAYVGANWWYWGSQANWVLGDETTGYIVIPAPLEEMGK